MSHIEPKAAWDRTVYVTSPAPLELLISSFRLVATFSNVCTRLLRPLSDTLYIPGCPVLIEIKHLINGFTFPVSLQYWSTASSSTGMTGLFTLSYR